MNTGDVMYQLVIPLVAQFAFDLAVIGYTLFFAIHAAQRVADPFERGVWLVIILVSNVLGATFYFLTKYRRFKAIGKGRLLFPRRNNQTLKSFISLTESEKN
jgi:hypothetical protein